VREAERPPVRVAEGEVRRLFGEDERTQACALRRDDPDAAGPTPRAERGLDRVPTD